MGALAFVPRPDAVPVFLYETFQLVYVRLLRIPHLGFAGCVAHLHFLNAGDFFPRALDQHFATGAVRAVDFEL